MLNIIDIIVLIYCVLVLIVLIEQSISEKALYELSVNNTTCMKMCSFELGICLPTMVIIFILQLFTFIIFMEV